MPTKLSQADREALTRALEQERNSGEPGRRAQLDKLSKTHGWFTAAELATDRLQRAADAVRHRARRDRGNPEPWR